MSTMLERVSLFNQLIGNEKGSFSKKWSQMDLIAEEIEELVSALGACDRIKIRDGIADVLVTVLGLAHLLDIDADADFNAVHESNMSKFIESNDMLQVQEAVLEVASRLGIECCPIETQPGLWAITSAAHQIGSNGAIYPKGKLLKPASYREPIFREEPK